MFKKTDSFVSNARWEGDAGYHKRHSLRSLKRARRIGYHIRGVESFLDVGCNEGIVSEYLLRKGKVKAATGIEISNVKVSHWLENNDQFLFINDNIENLDFSSKYDCIFYGAVHHHIVRERGLDIAVEVFQKLAAACSGKIYFETGQLTEGGRWEWQRKLSRYFSNDEEHFLYLLRAIEPVLDGFKVIGKFSIHGVRRYLCEITIKEPVKLGVEYDFNFPACSNKYIYSSGRSQDLVRQEDGEGNLLGGRPSFGKVDTIDRTLFVKKRSHAAHIDVLEYQIGRSLDFVWNVAPLGLSAEGLVFPWVEGETAKSFKNLDKASRSCVSKQLDVIIFDAVSKEVVLPSYDSLLIYSSERKLVDIVDFNENNFLVSGRCLYVVDFEYFSDFNRYRNYLHFANLYYLLGSFRKSLKYRFWGWGGMVKLCFIAIFEPFEIRVIKRSPSLVSFLVVKFRSFFGRLLVKLFPVLDER